MNSSLLKPIAVTGATGFIGSHLLRALSSAGHEPIVLTSSETKRVNSAKQALIEEFVSAEMDFADELSICGVLRELKPATLFHLAGTRGHGDARGASAACMEVNYHATARVLNAAVKAGVRRIVIVGSAEEYGNQSGPLRESMDAKATTAYGISKAMATNFAKEAHERDGCPVVVVRLFTVYGPGQPAGMFVAEAVDSAVRNVEFRMSRGDQNRDLIFVNDVVRGLISAARATHAEGRVINLGSGQGFRLRDVAELIWRLTSADAPLLIGARGASKTELYDTWADITLARQLLEWRPRVDLETGLLRTIDFARKEMRDASQAKSCQAM